MALRHISSSRVSPTAVGRYLSEPTVIMKVKTIVPCADCMTR